MLSKALSPMPSIKEIIITFLVVYAASAAWHGFKQARDGSPDPEFVEPTPDAPNPVRNVLGYSLGVAINWTIILLIARAAGGFLGSLIT